MSTIISEEQVRKIFASQLMPNGPYDLQIERAEDEDGTELPLYLIKHPWSDSTLAMAVPLDVIKAKELAKVLDRVELPDAYSGVYHKKTNRLEVFWTAFKVRDKHAEVATRAFNIWWRGEKRTCNFGPASDDAMLIASATLPFAAASHTEHRNIMSFHYFVHGSDHQNLETPICFWLDCSGIAESDLDEYVRTVNFYMTYYDRETPRVLIHEAGPKEIGSTRPRYAEGSFPSDMVASGVDPSVMSFWLGAFETRDPAMKYLLHYRLIEFLSNSHIKGEQHKELISILRRPHLISSTEGAAAEIAGLFALKARETDRIKEFVGEAVSPKKVWGVLEMNKNEFCGATCFDGGYVIKAVIGKETNFESWEKSGPISLVDKLRAIRNCLAHGQDEGTKGVIHTTLNNRRTLMPWVNLIETFAAEAMLYSRRTYVSGDSDMSTTE